MEEGALGLTPGANRALRVRPTALEDDPTAIARALKRPPKPIEFERYQGREPHDLIGTTYSGLILVSERFLELLRTHEFSGWTTFPARVVLQDGRDLAGYHGFAVTGRCGPIDDSLSERVIFPPPVPEGRERPGLRGMCFDPETWDGSDVFMPGESVTSMIVTEQVKRAVEEAGLTNVEFARLTEIERTWGADGSPVD